MGVLRMLLADETGSPHGWSLLWEVPLIWLRVMSDALIARAYLAIMSRQQDEGTALTPILPRSIGPWGRPG
jgi:hypothetical protein